jgi:hypothetical protein
VVSALLHRNSNSIKDYQEFPVQISGSYTNHKVTRLECLADPMIGWAKVLPTWLIWPFTKAEPLETEPNQFSTHVKALSLV